MKPKLIPPGTKRLKPQDDDPPSIFAFKINLRRYYMVQYGVVPVLCDILRGPLNTPMAGPAAYCAPRHGHRSTQQARIQRACR